MTKKKASKTKVSEPKAEIPECCDKKAKLLSMEHWFAGEYWSAFVCKECGRLILVQKR